MSPPLFSDGVGCESHTGSENIRAEMQLLCIENLTVFSLMGIEAVFMSITMHLDLKAFTCE
jgi:hypothetical protein